MCILVFSGNLYRLQLFQMEDPLFNVTLSWHHEEKTLICVTEWGRKQTQTLDSWGKNCEFIHSETQISKIYTVPCHCGSREIPLNPTQCECPWSGAKLSQTTRPPICGSSTHSPLVLLICDSIPVNECSATDPCQHKTQTYVHKRHPH